MMEQKLSAVNSRKRMASDERILRGFGVLSDEKNNRIHTSGSYLYFFNWNYLLYIRLEDRTGLMGNSFCFGANNYNRYVPN